MRVYPLLSGLLMLALWPSPSEGAPHGSRALAVIVPAGGQQAVSRAQLEALYLRERFHWSDGTPAEPINLPARNAARKLFSEAILGRKPQALEQYWNARYFNGILPPYVLNSPKAVLRFVARTRGAVGYVPYCLADDRVRIVLVITQTGRVRTPFIHKPCHR